MAPLVLDEKERRDQKISNFPSTKGENMGVWMTMTQMMVSISS